MLDKTMLRENAKKTENFHKAAENSIYILWCLFKSTF